MHIKHLLITFFFVLAVIVVAVLGYFYVQQQRAPEAVVSDITFPVATSTDGLSPGTPIMVASTEGDAIVTRDFINNGVTFEDPANEDWYYLAGDPGYCLSDGSCPQAGEDAGFNIIYIAKQSSFIIGLTTEPLGEVRVRAEKYLMETLGLNREQMCNLSYVLSTPVHVNEVYGSMGNLGFSFCPGSVRLP
ncbi:MAG TPA: hypothetical protein VGB97_02780 [Candidatus Paceibacterota bacterium]|jgi:hypothetical protein